jgi:hypothetical protein
MQKSALDEIDQTINEILDENLRAVIDEILQGDALLKDKQVAKILNISRSYVHKLAEHGLIRCKQWKLKGDNKVNRRYFASSVKEFIET